MAHKKHDEMYEIFAEAYIEHNNATRSAKIALNAVGRTRKNYDSYKSEGRRLRNHPTVHDLIEKKRKAYLKMLGVNPEKVLAELAKIAFARLPDMFAINGTGEAVFDLNLMTPELEAAFGEYTVDTYMEGRGEDAREVKKVRVKLNNKLDALDKLMKHFGLYEADNKQSTDDLIERIHAGRKRARKNAQVAAKFS